MTVTAAASQEAVDGKPLTSKWQGWRRRPLSTTWVSSRTGKGITDGGEVFSCPRDGRRQWVTPAELLVGLPEAIGRVYLTGDRPGVSADDVRLWGLKAVLPLGWEENVEGGGHWLKNPELPVYRWAHLGGRTVEVLMAATWLDGECSPPQARAAMQTLGWALRQVFNPQGKRPVIGEGYADWLTTPATTGRLLWAATIPHGVSWEVLPVDLQDLIRLTSTQGRVELRSPEDVGDTLPGLVGLDMRLAYAAYCSELGYGPVTHDWGPYGSASGAGYEGFRRGRYRVTVTVPDNWAHVGLLPVKSEDGRGWSYPSRPGTRFETWADGCELKIAQDQGWPFTVRERMLFAGHKANPLGPWADKMVRARWLIDEHEAKGDIRPEIARLARIAIRAILLHGIGAFHGRPHKATRTATLEEAEQIPADLLPELVGDTWMWLEDEPGRLPWLSHPEWSSQIWARCRAGLLWRRNGVGALHLPARSVVAFRLDAIYATHNPGWPDDSRTPGQFRSKGILEGPVRTPRDAVELMALRDAMEAREAA